MISKDSMFNKPEKVPPTDFNVVPKKLKIIALYYMLEISTRGQLVNSYFVSFSAVEKMMIAYAVIKKYIKVTLILRKFHNFVNFLREAQFI